MITFCQRKTISTRTPRVRRGAAHHRQRCARFAGLLGILLPALFGGSLAHGAQSVVLAWDENPDPAVVGYNVYYGGESGNYTNVTSIGKVGSVVISGLVEGATYYFAMTAVDAFGNATGFQGSNSIAVQHPHVHCRRYWN